MLILVGKGVKKKWKVSCKRIDLLQEKSGLLVQSLIPRLDCWWASNKEKELIPGFIKVF